MMESQRAPRFSDFFLRPRTLPCDLEEDGNWELLVWFVLSSFQLISGFRLWNQKEGGKWVERDSDII